MTVPSYDNVASLRYANAESRPDSFSLRMAPRIKRLFERNRTDRDGLVHMLDIGSGTGQLTDYFRHAGYHTVGLDRSFSMLSHRVQSRSGDKGAVAVADAALLPLSGQFQLITATFNVINHLSSKSAVASMLAEVARLLSPNGIFVFDMNTPLGLARTASHVEIVTDDDGFTVWTRQLRDAKLVLNANGSFVHDGTRHRYRERIEKLVVTVGEFEQWCDRAGLSQPKWLADDFETAISAPENHATVFGVVQPRPNDD